MFISIYFYIYIYLYLSLSHYAKLTSNCSATLYTENSENVSKQECRYFQVHGSQSFKFLSLSPYERPPIL